MVPHVKTLEFYYLFFLHATCKLSGNPVGSIKIKLVSDDLPPLLPPCQSHHHLPPELLQESFSCSSFHLILVIVSQALTTMVHDKCSINVYG